MKMHIFLLSALTVSFLIQTANYKNSLSTWNVGKINGHLASFKIQQCFRTLPIFLWVPISLGTPHSLLIYCLSSTFLVPKVCSSSAAEFSFSYLSSPDEENVFSDVLLEQALEILLYSTFMNPEAVNYKLCKQANMWHLTTKLIRKHNCEQL